MSENKEKESEKKKEKISKKQIIGNYQIEKTIGEGTFGKVKLGIHIPTEEKVAIKILEKDKIQDREDLERISREINFLKKLNHPNIIKIYDIIENSKNFYIIMELANNGELFKYIVKKKKLDEVEASFFYYQLILGLEAIHKEKIVHRDIKPENLLLKENNILTIIDFGLSNQYKKNQYLKTSCGSPCYAAPEMILGRKYNGLLVDLWSSGIVLYAMVCGYLPFEDKNNDKLYKKILNGKFDLPSRLSNECKDLIKKILTVNPKNRIGIEGVKSHPFLTRASLNYHIDDVLLRNEKGKYCDIIIEKMVNMKTYNFKKEDIIFNLDNNKHNNITATYELLLKKYKLNVNMRSGLSGLYSMTSASSFGGSSNVKTSVMKINLKKDEKNEKEKKDKGNNNKKSSNESRNNSNSKISKSYRSKNSSVNNRKRYNRNTFNGSSVNRTIDSNNSNQSSKNDFSSSLDISKVVKKNKIDSNIIIGIPKLVPVDKKLFTNVKNKFNNNNNKKTNSQTNEYEGKYKKKKKNYSRSKSKNSEINTSVSYERSSNNCKLNPKNKSKSKEIMYIPSNTINLMEIMNSKNNLNKESNSSSQSSFNNNDKTVNHYSSFNINDNNNDTIEFYPRSRSNYIKLNKKNKTYLIKNTSFNQNAESKYLLTFNEDSNLYLNKTVSNRSKISNCSISSSNSQMSYNLHNKGKNSRAIQVENSFPKTQIHQKKNNQIYFHKKNCKSNINSNLNNYNSNNLSKKIQSPTHKNNSTSNYYCPSFTETNSISNISTSKKKNQINTSNVKKGNNEITITIKKENSITENKNMKNNTVTGKKTVNSIRPVSPVNLITQFSESNNKNKSKQNYKINSIRQKPTTVDIDITINTKEQKDNNTNNHSHHQIKNRKGNNSKNKKISINSQRKNSVKNLNKKSLHSKTHDVNVIKLVSDDSKSNVTKTKKTNNNNLKVKNPKNQPVEINFDLENDIDMKNKMISNKRDFALCTTNSSLEEINDKLTLLCIDNGLTLTKIDNLKYICKKNSDNSINIEVSTVGKNNVLKLYHLNGQESITKEIIKNIIITLAF